MEENDVPSPTINRAMIIRNYCLSLFVVVILILILSNVFRNIVDPVTYLSIVSSLITITTLLVSLIQINRSITDAKQQDSKHRQVLNELGESKKRQETLLSMVNQLMTTLGMKKPIQLDSSQTSLEDYQEFTMKLQTPLRRHGIDSAYDTKINRNLHYARKLLFSERTNYYDLHLWVKKSTRKWTLLGSTDADLEKKQIVLTDFFFEELSVFDLKTASDFEYNLLSQLLGITPNSLRALVKEAKMMIVIPISGSYSLMVVSSFEDTNILKETRLAEISSIAKILVEEFVCPKCEGRLEETYAQFGYVTEGELPALELVSSCDSCGYAKYKENVSEMKNRAFENHKMRVQEIKKNQTHKPMRTTPKLVMHIFPLRYSYDFEERFRTPDMIKTINNIPPPQRWGPEGWLHEATGEGRLNYTHEKDCRAYVHFSWNGTIEAVHAGLFTDLDGKQIPISSFHLQYVIYNALKNYLSFLENIGIEPPLAIFITLSDVEGYQVSDDKQNNSPKGGINGKRSRTPNINAKMREVRDYQERIFPLVKRIVDNIWNEIGWNESEDFSNEIENEK